MSELLLARYPLLGILPAPVFAEWYASGQNFACAAGTTLLQENTPGAWLYLVREGRVRILRESGAREVTLGILRPGDLFGEYALLPPGRNTATCRTAAPTRLFRLPLTPLAAALKPIRPVWKNLKNWLRLHTLLHFYRERAFLGFMSAESSLKLLDRVRPFTFAAGETIQAGGLCSDCWHVIERGTVRLGDAATGVTLGRGESFGERALAGSGELPLAVAESDVTCQILARHEFDPHAQASSQVAQSYQARVDARPAEHVWVPQLGPADCGVASLAMVALRCKAGVSIEQLRERATPGPCGLSLQQLQKLATEAGLPCQAVRVSADRLRKVNLPAVAHLSDGHYVVLHEIGPNGVVVGDPETGLVTWAFDFLAKCYSGSLVVFDPPSV